MILTSEQRQQALKVVDDCLLKVKDHFKHPITPPTIMFNQRGKIAGTAHLQRNLVKLNSVLMADNFNEFLLDVIPHETAHIVVYQLYGKVRPHGLEWQNIMRDIFKRPPTVRHSMDVSKTQGQQFEYYCGCGPISLSIRRHNKVKRQEQVYRCSKCQQTLVAKSI